MKAEPENFYYYKVRNKGSNGSHGKPFYVYEGELPQYSCKVFKNLQGGWCLKENVEILSSGLFDGTMEEFIKLHRKEIYSYLINENSRYGWLSPNAEFYGVDYTNHMDCAQLYFGKEEDELEAEGWIKVFKEYNSHEPVYAQFHANEAQLKWLYDHSVHYSKFV